MSKGSRRRSTDKHKLYANNWNLIFKKDNKNEQGNAVRKAGKNSGNNDV